MVGVSLSYPPSQSRTSAHSLLLVLSFVIFIIVIGIMVRTLDDIGWRHVCLVNIVHRPDYSGYKDECSPT